MKTMNVVIIVLIVLALFITGYIFIKKSLPPTIPVESIKYSFPVSKDVPKAEPEPTPTYDIPSTNLPEPIEDKDEIPAEKTEEKATPPKEPVAQ